MKNKINDFLYKIFYKEKIEKEKKGKLIAILTVFFVIIVIMIILTAPVLAYQYLYTEKIYSGVYIDGINVGGLTKNQAIDKLNQHLDSLSQNGLTFNYKKQNYNIGFTIVSSQDPDLAFAVLDFNVEQMVENAFEVGRKDNWLVNLISQGQVMINEKIIALDYDLNKAELSAMLQSEFNDQEQPAQNPQIVFNKNNQIIIKPEKSGFVIDYQEAINDLENELNLIAIQPIELQTKQSFPELTQKEAEKALPLIKDIIKKEKFTLVYEDKKWEVYNNDFKTWLGFNNQAQQASLQFDAEKSTEKIKSIAKEINIEPQDAKIVLEDGKVTEFLVHKTGLEVDLEKSAEKINQEFFNNKKEEIELVVNEIEPKIKTEEVNDLGIKEIIGVGISDFSGSSTNRIGNITTASKKLNGMLIKPDEEFSLVDRIGEVTVATGYFSEWVIKGDRTIKEYGGGLCQIATTTFRAAIYAGLPITERKPHSYIVSYYNPIGFDAAIYGPHPDVRFINDTSHYILFQTEMHGTELKFTFWGTSDSRKVEVTTPEIYNWRGAPPDKLISNPSLAPGQKILKEAARRGADTHFYRYLTLPGQETKEEIYRSHYVAWPAIYEVGLSEEAPLNDEEVPSDEIVDPGITGEEAASVNDQESVIEDLE